MEVQIDNHETRENTTGEIEQRRAKIHYEGTPLHRGYVLDGSSKMAEQKTCKI